MSSSTPLPDSAPVEHAPPAPLAPLASSSAPDDEPPPSSILQIIPGPYSGPMSRRAATRFARGGYPSVRALARRGTSPLAVLALVFALLVAAGGIGSALAFRFGKARVTTSVVPAHP